MILSLAASLFALPRRQCLTIAPITLPILQIAADMSTWCNAKRYARTATTAKISVSNVSRARSITGDHASPCASRSVSLITRTLAKEMFMDERCQIVAARCRKLEVLLDRMGRALISPASVRVAKKSGALAPLKNCVDPIIPDV
jgi:hypothetical protein